MHLYVCNIVLGNIFFQHKEPNVVFFSNVTGMGGLPFGGQTGMGAETSNTKYGESLFVYQSSKM